MSATSDDTVMDALAAQARSFKPLPEDEVAVLLLAAARNPTGPEVARLVEHHLIVALDQALLRGGRGLELPDLYQEATLAVTVAVGEYADRGGNAAGLKRYVTKVVDHHLEAALTAEEEERERDRAMVRDAEQLQQTELTMRVDLGREATVAELAVALEWTPARVSMVHSMLQAARQQWDEEISMYLDPAGPADDDVEDEA